MLCARLAIWLRSRGKLRSLVGDGFHGDPSTPDAVDSVPIGLGSLARIRDLSKVREAADWVRPRRFRSRVGGVRMDSVRVHLSCRLRKNAVELTVQFEFTSRRPNP